MLKQVDHIGIAVKSIDETKKFYENVLGLKCEHVEEVASQRVKTAFFKLGEVHIELLEPTSPESPIAKFIETKGEGIHHIAYYSDDIQAQLDGAKNAGCRLINEVPIEGAHGKKVAFLHPKSSFGVLTEICSGGC